MVPIALSPPATLPSETEPTPQQQLQQELQGKPLNLISIIYTKKD